MKAKYIILINFVTSLLGTQILFSQNLSFENQTVITQKVLGESQFLGPMIPYNYNSDNYIDFFGNSQTEFLKSDNGNFTLTTTNCFTKGDPVKLIDFNKDGILDYVNSKSININSGNGAFTVIHSPNPNSTINEVADIDNDGFMDIITGEYNITLTTGKYSIWYNDGNNNFTETVLNANYLVTHTAIADLNKDGNLDIITGSLSEVRIFINNGSRMFTSHKMTYTSFDKSIIGLLDIDKDNDLDAIVSRPNNGLSTIQNTTNFSDNFLGPKSTLFSQSIITFVLEDLNNDGDVEIILLHNKDSKITISYTNIKSNFSINDFTVIGQFADYPSSHLKAQGNIMKNNISIFDYNFDGKKDVIYSDGFNNQLHLMLNSTPVGTGNLEFEKIHFSIFPNPVENELHLTAFGYNDEVICKIYNTIGQQISSTSFNNNAIINVATYPKGSYIVHLQSKDSTKSMNWVKN